MFLCLEIYGLIIVYDGQRNVSNGLRHLLLPAAIDIQTLIGSQVINLPSIPGRPHLISRILINQQGFDVDFDKYSRIIVGQMLVFLE